MMQPISCANSTGPTPSLNDDETNLYLSINHNLLIHNPVNYLNKLCISQIEHEFFT